MVILVTAGESYISQAYSETAEVHAIHFTPLLCIHCATVLITARHFVTIKDSVCVL